MRYDEIKIFCRFVREENCYCLYLDRSKKKSEGKYSNHYGNRSNMFVECLKEAKPKKICEHSTKIQNRCRFHEAIR